MEMTTFVPEWSERLSYELFVFVAAIYFRRVEEGVTFLVCPSDQADGFRFARAGSVTVREPHAAETDRRYFHISEFSRLHAFLIYCFLTSRNPQSIFPVA